MKVHLFRGKSIPSVVNFCMRRIADDNEERFSELAIDTMRRSFYMDDMIRSVASPEDAKKLISEMQLLLKAGGFDLGKFMSTSREVIESVPEEKLAKSLQNLDLHDSSLPQESALGLKWNVEGDFFTYSVNLNEKPLTKRGLLATTASLYDPLGLVAPVLLVPKLIQQDLCRLDMDWDDELPEGKAADFCKWRDNTAHLSTLKIPRCLQDGSSAESDHELHIFTDASEFAYGVAAYIKVINDSGSNVSLIMGKSRVAPLKSISIPRLELTAATVGAKLSQFLMEELDLFDVSIHFWTDSMTVLRYLRNVSTRFKIFVAHRVQQIQDATDVHSWNYVPSEQNPADLASRGVNPEDDAKLQFWLNGPEFLKESSQYTRLFEEPCDAELELEVRAACAVERVADLNAFISHYSSLTRLQKAVVWLRKFVQHRRGQNVKKEISVAEMESALILLIDYISRSHFDSELKAVKNNAELRPSSKLSRLHPIMENGLLCVGGRLENAECIEKHQSFCQTTS